MTAEPLIYTSLCQKHMAVQEDLIIRAGTGIVLEVADKQHAVSGDQLAKYPDSLFSKLATAELAAGSSKTASDAKVLQLDSMAMASTPLVHWPESAAPIICSLYRCGHIHLDLLDSLLLSAANNNTSNRNSSSSSSSSCSIHNTIYMQLLKLLDYLQLSRTPSSTSSSAHSMITPWLPRATDTPLRCSRILHFLYYCFAAEAVHIMLSYKPHNDARRRGFSRPSSAAFILTLDEAEADPSLCVRALAIKTDLAGNGLRTAVARQAFSDSNSAVIRNLNAAKADVVNVAAPELNRRSGCWQSGFVKDLKQRAVGVSHPLMGQAVQDALLAAVGSAGLGAGFTWAKGEGEVHDGASAPALGTVRQRVINAKVPVWVLWW